MLFDPKWNREASLQDFIAWLETKDPNEVYRYDSAPVCALGQYYKSKGLAYPITVVECSIAMNADYLTLALIIFEPGFGGTSTFGRALSRARNLVHG